jgi:CRISPR-associated endonuclease Csn1
LLSKLKIDRSVDTNIVLELPRCSNSKEERQLINDLQKINSDRKKIVISKLEDIGKDTDVDEATIYRLSLYYEQDCRDIYTGKSLDIDNVINNIDVQVDHILPISKTADNSASNKVLTSRENN